MRLLRKLARCSRLRRPSSPVRRRPRRPSRTQSRRPDRAAVRHRRQSARRAGRPQRPEARRQRGRRGDRGPGDAVAGRAAKLGRRRRRVHDLLRRRAPARSRVYDGREVAPAQATSTMFLDSDGQAAAVQHRGGQRARDRRSRRGQDARPRARRAWQAAVVEPVRRCRAHRATRASSSARASARMIHADFAENHAPDVIAYFSRPDGTLLNAGDRLVQQALCRVPAPPRRAGPGGALLRLDRGEDHRPHPRRRRSPDR